MLKRARGNATCKFCTLRDRRPVLAEAPEDGAIHMVILGEAPGEEEDENRQPFYGPSGRLLNWVLGETGVKRNRCLVTNAVSCRPTDNNIDGIEGETAKSCCRPGLVEELQWAHSRGARTILALGATAAKALGIEGNLTKYRGSVFELKFGEAAFRVVPTFHPAAILRQHWKRSGGGTADGMVMWKADIAKAKDIADGNWTDLVEDFDVAPTADDVVAFIEAGLKAEATFAVDIETTGLHPDYAQIVVIGLATSATKAMSVPLLTTGGEAYFVNGAWAKVQAALRRLFAEGRQVYQNGFFDIPIIRRHGFAVPYGNIVHDTLLLHHTLAAEAKHDLGTIVSIYGKTPYWKEEFLNRTGTILEMDQLKMREYNLRDCVVLHQVLPPMLKDLAELGLEGFYRDEVLPLIGPIMDMTSAGMGFDPVAVAKYKKTMTKMAADAKAELYALGKLPPGFSLDSGDHLRWFFYGIEPDSFKKLEELPKKRAGTKIHAELTALAEVRDKVRPLYQLSGWKPRATESGDFATNKQALLGYQIQLNNRLRVLRGQQGDTAVETAAILALLEFIDKFGKYNLYRKLVSTYTEYKPYRDGRIHPRWLMHGTVSGRLSSREPNLQNLPKRRDESDDPRAPIRAFFTAGPGRKLISCDYVNLEAQLLAYETLDPQLCEVFTKGLNLHDINTMSLFKIGPEDPKWKWARRAAKVFFFGGISYGGGDFEIFDKVSLEAPELHLTFAEFKVAKDNWMRDHPAYVAWKQRVTDEVMAKREITTEFGRKRIFLGNDRDIVKEALNFKIQSSGASLVNRAMVRIYAEVEKRGLTGIFVAQIHDQLVMEAPEAEAAEIAKLMVAELEKPFKYKGFTRKIGVECEIGDTFAEV